MISSREVVI